MKKIIAFLAAWTSVAVAQEPPIDEAAAGQEPLRRYTVEIIVFAYTEDVSVGSEIFLPDDPPPGETPPEFDDIALVDEVAGLQDTEAEEDQPPSWIVVPAFSADAAGTVPVPANRLPAAGGIGVDEPNPFELVLLDEKEFQLGKVADKFELLDAYETILHFGWTQPTFPEETTPPIELQLLTEPPAGLAGTLTLYLSRYLHLVVDLALDAPSEFEEEVVDDESFYRFGDSRQAYGEPYRERVMPVRFRIQENRIVKNGDIRYFDHPKFGVVAKVTRVEEPDAKPVDDSALSGRLAQ